MQAAHNGTCQHQGQTIPPLYHGILGVTNILNRLSTTCEVVAAFGKPGLLRAKWGKMGLTNASNATNKAIAYSQVAGEVMACLIINKVESIMESSNAHWPILMKEKSIHAEQPLEMPCLG